MIIKIDKKIEIIIKRQKGQIIRILWYGKIERKV